MSMSCPFASRPVSVQLPMTSAVSPARTVLSAFDLELRPHVLAHSLPFRYTHTENGAYAIVLMNSGPQSGSRMQK
jgi:hypothetical protein